MRANTGSKLYKELQKIFGKQYISSTVNNSFDYITVASNGMQAEVIHRFRNYFDLNLDETASILGVSEPTIYRWTQANKTLERNFSVQLLEVSDLFFYGIEVFDSKPNFFKWLNLPNTAFGGLEPEALLEIPGGLSKVRDVLGRIEQGVYS